MRPPLLLDCAPGSSAPSVTAVSGLSAPIDTFDEVISPLVPCRNNDPELWFAERTVDVELAKALCQECPLRSGCLTGAVDRREPWGVWGGEVFVDGEIVAIKRGRGRPPKQRTA